MSGEDCSPPPPQRTSYWKFGECKLEKCQIKSESSVLQPPPPLLVITSGAQTLHFAFS
jgi:hypothetical protein